MTPCTEVLEGDGAATLAQGKAIPLATETILDQGFLYTIG